MADRSVAAGIRRQFIRHPLYVDPALLAAGPSERRCVTDASRGVKTCSTPVAALPSPLDSADRTQGRQAASRTAGHKVHEPGVVVPDAWPNLADLRAVDRVVAEANAPVNELAIVVSDRYRAYMEKDAGVKVPLSVEGYGALMLYLDSLDLALGSAAGDVKQIQKHVEAILWEAVDLDGAADAS